MWNINPSFPYANTQPVDIGQVNSEQEAVNAYVAAGRSKIMFSSDDNTVYVKCVGMNGQATIDVFERRQAVPASPEYVTREELDRALEALKSPDNGVKKEAGK